MHSILKMRSITRHVIRVNICDEFRIFIVRNWILHYISLWHEVRPILILNKIIFQCLVRIEDELCISIRIRGAWNQPPPSIIRSEGIHNVLNLLHMLLGYGHPVLILLCTINCNQINIQPHLGSRIDIFFIQRTGPQFCH